MENMSKLDNDVSTSLASSGITHCGPGAKQQFHTQILKRFVEALIKNIKERLPDTVLILTF